MITMLKLLNSHTHPVGGIRFIDPDTDFTYNRSYKSFEELEAHVIEYREQNKLPPIDNLREVWENWICQEFGMEGKCAPVGENIKRTFEQYIKGGRAWIRTLLKKDKWVSQEEAEKRAATCADCNQNLVNIGHRHSQFYTDKFMQYQTGGRKTKNDVKLYTCKVCTCLLRSKVHYQDDVVAESLSDTEVGKLMREPKHLSTKAPLRCWQVNSLEKNKS